MGSYIPSTAEERREMLKSIGLLNPEDLFQAIPEELRVKKLEMEGGLSELELSREVGAIAR